MLKLSEPINSVTPYEVDKQKISPGAEVFLASSGSQDFYVGESREPHLKTIDRCFIKRTWRKANAPTLLETNCDGAFGTSGGPLLVRSSSGAYRILGVVFGSPQGVRDKRIDGPYKTLKWATYSFALEAEFRAALDEAIRRGPVSKPKSQSATPIMVFPTLDKGKVVFPSLSVRCEEGADADGCRKP